MSCPCLVLVRIFRKILPVVCLRSGFCPVSACPDFISLDSVRCPNFDRIFVKKLPIVCLSGCTRTAQRYTDFWCPCPPTSGLMEFVCKHWRNSQLGKQKPWTNYGQNRQVRRFRFHVRILTNDSSEYCEYSFITIEVLFSSF